MKALKTKVILSGIVLMIAFIATIGTTYAWFTVSTTTTIEQLDLSVTAADNLLIMPYEYDNTNGWDAVYVNDGSQTAYDLATPSNYFTSLLTSDLVAAGYLYEDAPGASTTPWRFAPATNIATDYSDFDGATINVLDAVAGTVTAATANKNAGQYIQLKFWLLLQGEVGTTSPIELTDNFAITTSEGGVEAQVINAVRLSVFAGEAGAVSGPTTPTSAVIFGTGSGDYAYDFTGTVYDSSLGSISRTGDVLDDLDAGYSDPGNLDADAAAAVLTDTTTDLFTITANTPTLVTVNIWVEGWDSNATNEISLATFSIVFGFKVGA